MFASANPGQDIWIRIGAEKINNVWTWVNGSEISDTLPFTAHSPGTSYCAYMSRAGKLKQTTYTGDRGFICQTEALQGTCINID